MQYEDYLKGEISKEATRLLAAATRLNIHTGLSFAIADAARAVAGGGDVVQAGIQLNIECLRTLGAIEGFDYSTEIAQLQTMLQRMQSDGEAYRQEIAAGLSE